VVKNLYNAQNPPIGLGKTGVLGGRGGMRTCIVIRAGGFSQLLINYVVSRMNETFYEIAAFPRERRGYLSNSMSCLLGCAKITNVNDGVASFIRVTISVSISAGAMAFTVMPSRTNAEAQE
jgi:hypothetical protein